MSDFFLVVLPINISAAEDFTHQIPGDAGGKEFLRALYD